MQTKAVFKEVFNYFHTQQMSMSAGMRRHVRRQSRVGTPSGLMTVCAGPGSVGMVRADVRVSFLAMFIFIYVFRYRCTSWCTHE